ncbi:galanin receptor type 1-like [Hydractinia symbiolongicarpus]|uniref:galanin receptor type 1-like n=1 Tax=Hydractinia symbiolongicarpus TaxID=13093 RepID=UPI00254B126C|nr:galanin receptor type 1-like [Hydractinia symbiolongicarpus]
MEFTQVLVLFLFSLGVIFHSFGIYLLHQTKKSSPNKTQWLYLLNLSVAELVLCVTGASRRFFKFIHHKEIAMSITLYQWTGCLLVYFIAMIALTVDRFLAVYLNIRYQLHCTEMKTNIFIISTWVISTLFAVIINESFSEEEILNLTIMYLFPVCEGTFLLIAIFTYAYFYKKVRRNRIRHSVAVSSVTAGVSEGENRRQKQRNNGLYVPTLIVITFVFFVILPDQVFFVTTILHIRISHLILNIMGVGYALGFILDAIIYVFLCSQVRRVAHRIFKRCCNEL